MGEAMRQADEVAIGIARRLADDGFVVRLGLWRNEWEITASTVDLQLSFTFTCASADLLRDPASFVGKHACRMRDELRCVNTLRRAGGIDE